MAHQHAHRARRASLRLRAPPASSMSRPPICRPIWSFAACAIGSQTCSWRCLARLLPDASRYGYVAGGSALQTCIEREWIGYDLALFRRLDLSLSPMPENLHPAYWQSLTTSDVPRAVQRDPVVIMPLAAIEQHGPHLPLSTDLDIGMGLLASAFGHLEDDFPAWVLPPLSVGASEEHMRFPGTLSLAPDTLSRIIYQYGAALSTSGVRRLVLSNSHGGNRAALIAPDSGCGGSTDCWS